jgi:hypothetical protein
MVHDTVWGKVDGGKDVRGKVGEHLVPASHMNGDEVACVRMDLVVGVNMALDVHAAPGGGPRALVEEQSRALPRASAVSRLLPSIS